MTKIIYDILQGITFFIMMWVIFVFFRNYFRLVREEEGRVKKLEELTLEVEKMRCKIEEN